MLDFRQSLMNSTLNKVLQRLHYPLQVMLTCVRWYVAYPLSLRHVEEMMQERGVFVDHVTVHRWAIKVLPVLAAVFRRRKHPVDRSWRMDETYIKVSGQWNYLYRAVDKFGDTVDFLLTAKRDFAAAWRFLERAINLHDVPEKITIDKSGANTAAIESVKADACVDIQMRQNKYLNNIIDAASSRSASNSFVSVMRSLKNQPSPIGSASIFAGSSLRAALTPVTSPEMGAKRSFATFTDSTTVTSLPCSTRCPTCGRSTWTTSPSCAWAYLVMPTTASLPSRRTHS